MKTGFLHGYPNKPVKKRYSYHGLDRDCLIQPAPGPFDEKDTDIPYGPEVEEVYRAFFCRGFYVSGGDYELVHNAAKAKSTKDVCGQSFKSYSYTIWRWALGFKTARIPEGVKITRATLTLLRTTSYVRTPFNMVIMNGMPDYPHSGYDLTDYALSHYQGNGGSCSISVDPPYYLIFDLTPAGLSWINSLGETKFLLVSSKDIASVKPTTLEYLGMSSSYSNHVLTVWYKTPL